MLLKRIGMNACSSANLQNLFGRGSHVTRKIIRRTRISRFLTKWWIAETGLERMDCLTFVVFFNAERNLPSKARYTMGCGPASKSADPADARETGG